MKETATFRRPSLMGILNLTDNSFLKSSRAAGLSDDALVERVEGMLADGANIIDIGACSTAPGNEPVGEEQEWNRLERPLRVLRDAFPEATFSLDSFRSGIVRKAIKILPDLIINDISAGEDDLQMLPLAASENLRYMAMCRTADPYAFFTIFSETAEKAGITDWILDPGFGFGKTDDENLEILHSLERLQDFGRPILVALSRKRMIWRPLALTPDTCADESFAAERLAASKGASIIRTHDLKLWSGKLNF